MPDEVWIVFDCDQPDAKVLGAASQLEACLPIISASGIDIDHKPLVIELPYSDAGYIKADAASYYGDEAPTPRVWRIQRHHLTFAT